MMFKKKTLASAMATALVAGAMVGGGAQAMHISETGQGQALLGPIYFAGGAYNSSRIRVVNTNTTNAVKGRIVFRSQKHSDECLDLVLYLSPGDVAYVDVVPDPANPRNALVKSDDDSIMATKGAPMSMSGVSFASQVVGGVTFPMAGPRTEPLADTCAMGHIEVTGVYAAQNLNGAAVQTNFGAVNVVMGMSKFDVYKIFETPKATLNALNNDLRVTNFAAPGNGADHANRVQLKATTEIVKADNSDRIMIPFTALRDGATPGSTLAVPNNFVMTNPALDTDPGQELRIGQNWLFTNNSAPVGIDANDALYDLEMALATNALNGFYVNDTNNLVNAEVTFPTKYRHMSGQYTAAWRYNAPWDAAGNVNRTVSLFDTQERTASTTTCFVSPCAVSPTEKLPLEVNYFPINGVPGFNPASGWVSIGISSAATGPSYVTNGIPAIGFMHYNQGGTRSVTDPLSRR